MSLNYAGTFQSANPTEKPTSLLVRADRVAIGQSSPVPSRLKHLFCLEFFGCSDIGLIVAVCSHHMRRQILHVSRHGLIDHCCGIGLAGGDRRSARSPASVQTLEHGLIAKSGGSRKSLWSTDHCLSMESNVTAGSSVTRSANAPRSSRQNVPS